MFIQSCAACLQLERKVASEDMRYRCLLWIWAALHCGLLVLCADAVHGHNMHPLACIGQSPFTVVSACVVLSAVVLHTLLLVWLHCCIRQSTREGHHATIHHRVATHLGPLHERYGSFNGQIMCVTSLPGKLSLSGLLQHTVRAPNKILWLSLSLQSAWFVANTVLQLP